MIEFGKRLRNLRTEKRLTQKQLASMVGLTPSAICAYEMGDRYPTYDVMKKFVNIFHVSSDFLLGIKEPRHLDLTGISDDDIELLVQLADRLRKQNK